MKRYRGYIPPAKLRDFYAGRLWDEARLPEGITQEEVARAKRAGYLQAYVAVDERCMRCGNTHIIAYDSYLYCRHCLTMGRLTNQTTLLTWQGQRPRFMQFSYNESSLSEAQASVSAALIASLQQKRSHLLDAVCGAGKTEMLFGAIAYALKRGLRVAVATPRADVVRELAPRLRHVFPSTCMHVLYGGAEKQAGCPQLIVATTHQLYHFYEAFDVMIVDEADAFPYTYDEALQRAVYQAKKPQAPIIFVTATPSKTLVAEARRNHYGHSSVWRRYHGFLLPEPRYSALFHYAKTLKKRLPKKLKDWTLERLKRNEPFLIFFPTKKLMHQALPYFTALDARIMSVHAEDEARAEKVQSLRDETCKGLLTTTILERGVTIKNVQVAVVGAEAAIFEASALIQISGRVGRNANYPNGDVVFFHHGITKAMDEARATIRKQNEVKQ